MSDSSAYPTGPGAWPSTDARYAITTAGPGVSVALDATAYSPAADEPAAAAADRARRDRRRFAAAHERLTGPDVTATLLTSLVQPPGADPTPLPVDADVLRRYVLGAYAYLGAAAAVGTVTVTGLSVDAVCAAYGVDAVDLGTANAGAVLTDLLGTTTMWVPWRASLGAGETIAALCAAHPPGEPVAILLDAANVALPLTPGVELATAPRTAAVPDASSAADLAERWHCTVAGLVTANAAVPGLLTLGFVFECDGFPFTVGGPDSETLDDVAAFFATRGVTHDVAAIVALNADVPGMFRAGATLTVSGYVAQPGDTLARNESGHSPAELAAANTETPGLFPAGTSLFVTKGVGDVTPDVTLAEFAAANGTTPGEVLRHNGDAVPSATVIPGTWSWPADLTTAPVPYTVVDGDTLDAVAQRFAGRDARQVVATSAWLPGTVAAGVTVTVGGTSVTTAAPSSFDEVRALFDPPADLDALAAQLAGRADVLAPGALLVCPPAVLPGTGALTPAEAVAPYGITPAALLSANAGTPDLLVPGTTLTVSGMAVRIAEHDTLTAVAGRLRRAGVSATVAEVVEDNAAVAFVRPGARVLVPPAAAVLDAGDAVTAWTFPSAVFPVRVSVAVSRDTVQVEPALKATPAATPRDGIDGLRYATATANDTDVWAVVFGPGGVAKVAIAPVTRTYAIRPVATTLATGSVTLPDGSTRSYRDADPEAWAAHFLAGVERVVSGRDARRAYELDPAAYDRVAAAKEALADAISRGLAPVLDGEDAGPDAAAETLRQRLLASLPAGYATTAAVRYDTDVASPWTEPYARLLGTAEPAGAPGAVALTAGAGAATFLADVPDAGAQRRVSRPWTFMATELEHGDEDAARLTFAEPFAIDLGEPSVPLALRAYPPPPVLADHDAQGRADAETLDAALHWDYVLTVEHRPAAQDVLGLTVTFDAPSPPVVAAAAPVGELVAALARCALWPLSPVRDRAALETYAGLVADVADAWSRHWREPAPATSAAAPGGGDVYALTARLVAGDDHRYATLDLTRTPVSGPGTVGWPRIAWVEADGTAHELTSTVTTDPARRVYAFPAGVAAFEQTTLRLTFPGLHVAAHQSASAHARVERNADLATAFAYRTPDVAFPAPAVPDLTLARPIPVADWSEATLAAVFDTVFDGDPDDRVMTVQVHYTYPLEPGGDGPLLPVLLLPPTRYDATVPAGLTAGMDSWLAEQRPAAAGASWVVGVTLFASADPQRPVARVAVAAPLSRSRD